MNEYVGKICPVCKSEINELDKITVCPDCGIPHHTECWEMNGGCSTFGCAQQGTIEAKEKKTMATCVKCGMEIGEDQAFCPKCGTPKNAPEKKICGKCGNELVDGHEFCPKCGQKVGLAVDSNVASAINQFNGGVAQQNAKKKKTPIIIGAVAAIAVIIVIVVVFVLIGGAKKGPDFQKLYDEYCKSTWATVGSDGSYLSLDTNPYDRDDDGLAYPAAYIAAKEINEALGLPDSLYAEFGETTGMDGKQSEDFPEQGVTVQWRYHPDKGLEITYKKLKK